MGVTNEMQTQKEMIIRLKKVREERDYSFSDIISRMEQNGDFVSRATLSRLFKEGSEDESFNYESTIRPIAKVLLDIETIEEDDNLDMQAMKSLLKYKIERIEELERQVSSLETAFDKEKLKYHDKLDAEREQFSKRIAFLMEQINLKDKRMDQLLEAVFVKDKQHAELLERVLVCQKCKGIKHDH